MKKRTVPPRKCKQDAQIKSERRKKFISKANGSDDDVVEEDDSSVFSYRNTSDRCSDSNHSEDCVEIELDENSGEEINDAQSIIDYPSHIGKRQEHKTDAANITRQNHGFDLDPFMFAASVMANLSAHFLKSSSVDHIAGFVLQKYQVSNFIWIQLYSI